MGPGWPRWLNRSARSSDPGGGARPAMTIDGVAGLALILVGLVAIEESRAFPFGTLHRPGPAFMPMLLAALQIVFGGVVFLMGRRARRLAEVGWQEWRHAVAIFAACAFAALGLERLGYPVNNPGGGGLPPPRG